MLKLLLSAVLATIQPLAPPPGDPLVTTDERRSAIIAANNAFTAATRSKDQTALAGLVAPEFGLTGADAADVLPRAIWMANLQRMTLHSYTTRVTAISSYGDLAITTVSGDWDVQLGDGPRMKESFLLADSWIWRDGRWQITRRYRVR